MRTARSPQTLPSSGNGGLHVENLEISSIYSKFEEFYLLGYNAK
jgi:hypothetical protein